MTTATWDEDQRRGPHDPSRGSPAVDTMSVRRTTTIDTSWPDGPSGDLIVAARGRDLRGGATPSVLGEAGFVMRLDGITRSIASVEPELPPELAEVRKATVTTGFRSLVGRSFAVGGPLDVGRHGLLHCLLDEIVMPSFIAGYAHMRADPPTDDSPATRTRFQGRVDLCAGYTADGTIGTWVQEFGHSPIPVGPPAPALVNETDDGGWHDLPPTPPHSMRRSRRVDLIVDGGGVATIDAMFRDEHIGEDGLHDVLHEYSVSGQFDLGQGTITSIEAQPRVLPWQECPAAAASAQFVLGVPVTDLRRRVLEGMQGPSTCTHLNDELRFLSDIGWLADVIQGDR
jgi:hypothetical protein